MAQTLTIDCGGGGIKASVLDDNGDMLAEPLRVPTPYPLPPQRFIETLQPSPTESGRPCETVVTSIVPVVTVGVPGMIRRGVVAHTPHYITVSGPRSRVDPQLCRQWTGSDAKRAISAAFGLPALALNDAEVHGADLVSSKGLELVLTPWYKLPEGSLVGDELLTHHAGRVRDPAAIPELLAPLLGIADLIEPGGTQ